MRSVIYDDKDRMLAWAANVIGIRQFRADAQAIGQERDGELIAVVVFDGFTDVDCNMHLASDGTARWMSRELLVRSFAYPFIQCRMKRVTGLVDAGNEEALRLNEHLGFVREGMHRMACADGGDLISMGLLRRDCRWIPAGYRHD